MNKKRLGKKLLMAESKFNAIGFNKISKRANGVPIFENKSAMHQLNKNSLAQSNSPNKTAVNGLNLKGLINSSKKHLKFEEGRFDLKNYKGTKSELKLNQNLKKHLREIISKNNASNLKSTLKA